MVLGGMRLLGRARALIVRFFRFVVKETKFGGSGGWEVERSSVKSEFLLGVGEKMGNRFRGVCGRFSEITGLCSFAGLEVCFFGDC